MAPPSQSGRRVGDEGSFGVKVTTNSEITRPPSASSGEPVPSHEVPTPERWNQNVLDANASSLQQKHLANGGEVLAVDLAILIRQFPNLQPVEINAG